MIPKVVPEKLLLAANALFGLAIFGSILVAYILSGPLLLLLHPVKMSLLIALLLFISAAVISLIKPHYKHHKALSKAEKELNIFEDIKNTLTLMSKTKEIFRSLFFLSLSQILILTLATIAPGYATQVLKIPVEEFPLVFVAPAALGMVIGAIVIVNFLKNRNRDKIITIGVFLSGIAMILLPFGSRVASQGFIHYLDMFLPDITTLHVMGVIAFILGIANSFVFVPANTLLQEKTPEELRGKIYGFMSSAIGILSLLPIIIVGGLSDLIGVGSVLTGIGATLLLLGFIQLFTH
jgi:MFS family permease